MLCISQAIYKKEVYVGSGHSHGSKGTLKIEAIAAWLNARILRWLSV